jgi:hypothetical protein
MCAPSFKLALAPVAAAILAAVIVAAQAPGPASLPDEVVDTQVPYFQLSEFYMALQPGGVGAASGAVLDPKPTATTPQVHPPAHGARPMDLGTPILNAVIENDGAIRSSVFAVFQS